MFLKIAMIFKLRFDIFLFKFIKIETYLIHTIIHELINFKSLIWYNNFKIDFNLSKISSEN